MAHPPFAREKHSKRVPVPVPQFDPVPYFSLSCWSVVVVLATEDDIITAVIQTAAGEVGAAIA
jgi:hypothetical protein